MAECPKTEPQILKALNPQAPKKSPVPKAPLNPKPLNPINPKASNSQSKTSPNSTPKPQTPNPKHPQTSPLYNPCGLVLILWRAPPSACFEPGPVELMLPCGGPDFWVEGLGLKIQIYIYICIYIYIYIFIYLFKI